jgi:hypothetical protein
MVLVEVVDMGDVLCEYDLGLEGAVNGVTRSIDLDPYDEPCGLFLGGRGRVIAGVNGNE